VHKFDNFAQACSVNHQEEFTMVRKLKMGMALCLGMAILHGCASTAPPACASAGCDSVLVYIGTAVPFTNGAPPPVREHGIFAARLDQRTGHLAPLGRVAAVDGSSWLVAHPHLPVLYSVGLTGNDKKAESSLYSFAIEPANGQLRALNQTGAGGTDATHLDLDAASMTLFSANHNSGDVSAVPVLVDGRLGPVASLQKGFGTGPHPRQNRPQTHGVAIDPSHRYVVTTDFGADKLFVYRFDPNTRTLAPAEKAFEVLPAGSGPRHLAFHPAGSLLFVNCELTGDVRSYQWDSNKGALRLVQTLSPYPVNHEGGKSAAEIIASRDGRFLYVSLRGGQDSVIVYAVDANTGRLAEVQRMPSGGKTPWSMGLDPSGNWLLVTNQGSDSIAVFHVDSATGHISATTENLMVPDPMSVTFAAH
jgi:6-phosphogluconolactonase